LRSTTAILEDTKTRERHCPSFLRTVKTTTLTYFTEFATQPCGHVTKTLVINLFTMSKSRTARSRPEGRTPRKNFFLSGDEKWWSQTGSNRRPQACKASALPTELWPRKPAASNSQLSAHIRRSRDRSTGGVEMVGLGRLELPTSRLSSARSNQLSYRPDSLPRKGRSKKLQHANAFITTKGIRRRRSIGERLPACADRTF